MLTVLDLFSGIGGFSLGLERTGGFRTVAFCECEDFPRKVLAKHWPGVPIFPDVRELTVETLADANGEREQQPCRAQCEERGWAGNSDQTTRTRGASILPIDVVVGGYPCQPFSVAGKRRGQDDDRHLWPEMHRLVAALRPRWVIGENVAGHIGMGLDDVLSDLEGIGYTALPFVVPACAVDAPHRRDRVWIIAAQDDADTDRLGSHRAGVHQHGSGQPADRQERVARSVCEVLAGPGDAGERRAEDVADTDDAGSQGRDGASVRECGAERAAGARGAPATAHDPDTAVAGRTQSLRSGEALRGTGPGQPAGLDGVGRCQWIPEPDVGRVAHGVPRRVDRLRALGNAVVPQVVEQIGRAILQAEAA